MNANWLVKYSDNEFEKPESMEVIYRGVGKGAFELYDKMDKEYEGELVNLYKNDPYYNGPFRGCAFLIQAPNGKIIRNCSYFSNFVIYPDENPKRIEVPSKWRKLAAKMLDLASEEFSNHRCNDWEFPPDWTVGEQREFVRAMHVDNGSLKDYDENFLKVPDWWVMSFLAEQLRQ